MNDPIESIPQEVWDAIRTVEKWADQNLHSRHWVAGSICSSTYAHIAHSYVPNLRHLQVDGRGNEQLKQRHNRAVNELRVLVGIRES